MEKSPFNMAKKEIEVAEKNIEVAKKVCRLCFIHNYRQKTVLCGVEILL